MGLSLPEIIALSKASNILFLPIEVRTGSSASTVVWIGMQTSAQIPKSIVASRCIGFFDLLALF